MDQIIEDELSSLIDTLKEAKGDPVETTHLFNIPGLSCKKIFLEDFLSANSLIHISKKGPTVNNGLSICKFKIRGPK
jgi:hypothetical protein